MNDRPKLSTEVADCEGIPVVRVRGEIDLYTVPEFEHALNTGIERGGSALIADLSNVSYLDSAGLSALLAAHKALSKRNSALCLVVSPGRSTVRRVMEITRIDNLVKIWDSVEEAVRELRLSEAA